MVHPKSGFILERGIAGFSQFGKKCRIKLNGALKITPRIRTIFGNIVFENNLQQMTTYFEVLLPLTASITFLFFV